MSGGEIAAALAYEKMPSAYEEMGARIDAALPCIARAAQAFGKTHSQFMYGTLDVTQLTTVRAIKHTLAEIGRTKAALQEAMIKQRRREIDLAEARVTIECETDPFQRSRIEVDIMEAQAQSAQLAESVQGAVRKLSYMVAQYQSLLAKTGKSEITEADYEADEARYHIMTAMKQALCAARARGGVIDEGNHIYLFDMGLPAAEAQRRILMFLSAEEAMLRDGKVPTHDLTLQFLERCADDWQAMPAELAKRRGVPLFDPLSLHKHGDL